MFQKLLDCFPRKLPPEVKALDASAMIGEFAKGMMALFEPIYLYTLGLSILQILFFYMGVYAIYFLTAPLGAKLAKYYGYTKGLMVGSVVAVIYFLVLVLMRVDHSLIYFGPLLVALYKTFYWPAYHAEFAQYCVHREAGRELSENKLLISLAQALSPFFGGLLIASFGFPTLFVVVVALVLISILPLLAVPDKFERTPFSYRDAYHRLFTPKNRHSLVAHVAFGEDLLLAVIWPIFLFTVFPKFSDLGGIVTIATVLSLAALLFIGEESDHHHKIFLLRVGSAIHAAAWFLRMAVSLPFAVFAVDTLSRLGSHGIEIPWMSRTYHLAQHEGVMRTVLFMEMALTLGKFLTLVLTAGLFWLLPTGAAMSATFFLGGALTLLYLLFVPNPHEAYPAR